MHYERIKSEKARIDSSHGICLHLRSTTFLAPWVFLSLFLSLSTGSAFRKDLAFRRYIFIKRTKPSFMQANHSGFEFIQGFCFECSKKGRPRAFRFSAKLAKTKNGDIFFLILMEERNMNT